MARQLAWRRKLRDMAHSSVRELAGAGSEHIEIAHAEDEDGDLVLCTFDAREGWKSARPRLLASADNPDGYELVELLEQIFDEVSESMGLSGKVLQ